MNPTLDTLVVGLGNVGSRYDDESTDGWPVTHASALARHPTTRLAGGVDPDADAAQRFSERREVPSHTDLTTALELVRPAIVSVCSPPETHRSVVEGALAAGARGIWCEKPLAPTAAEAEQIVSACAQAGVPLQVNFLRRFDPVHREVAERLAGRRFHADFRLSGTLLNYGSHAFDLFRWLGGDPAWVMATPVPEQEPLVVAGSVRGSTATVLQVTNETVDLFDVAVYAENTRITLTRMGEELAIAEAGPSAAFPGYQSLGHSIVERRDGLQRAMTEAVDSIVAAVERGARPLCDGTDGVAALRVHEAVKRSADTGAREAVEL